MSNRLAAPTPRQRIAGYRLRVEHPDGRAEYRLSAGSGGRCGVPAGTRPWADRNKAEATASRMRRDSPALLVSVEPVMEACPPKASPQSRPTGWTWLLARWAVLWTPGRLRLVPRDGARVPDRDAPGLEVAGIDADRTRLALRRLEAQGGKSAMDAWLTDTLAPDRGQAFATAAWNAEAGGWYRSDGRMVQRREAA